MSCQHVSQLQPCLLPCLSPLTRSSESARRASSDPPTSRFMRDGVRPPPSRIGLLVEGRSWRQFNDNIFNVGGEQAALGMGRGGEGGGSGAQQRTAVRELAGVWRQGSGRRAASAVAAFSRAAVQHAPSPGLLCESRWRRSRRCPEAGELWPAAVANAAGGCS